MDKKILKVKAKQEAQQLLLAELERLDFQDEAQKDDVCTSCAGATKLTAELAKMFIKEILVTSPTEIEIVWKFQDVFDAQSSSN